MFPISYELLLANMSPTVSPTAPMEPGNVYSLLTDPSSALFTFVYSGSIDLLTLNRELYFLSSAFKQHNNVGSLIFTELTITNSGTGGRLYIQDILIINDVIIDSSVKSLLSVSLFNLTCRSMMIQSGNSVVDLEISRCSPNLLTLPSSSLISLLLHGTYPQVKYTDLINKRLYPNLSILLYFNDVDGLGDIDLPSTITGFGSFNVVNDPSKTYTNITVYASSNPFHDDIVTRLPNLRTLMIIEPLSSTTSIVVPEQSTSSYRNMTILGGINLTTVDVSPRIKYLHNLRVTHCPLLSTLSMSTDFSTLKSLRVEYCSLLFISSPPASITSSIDVLIDNHATSAIGTSPSASSMRLFDYLPSSLSGGSNFVTNVVTQFVNNSPLLNFPLMLTTKFIYNVNSGLQPIVYKNTSANPIVPGNRDQLSAIEITESRHNLYYFITLVSSTPATEESFSTTSNNMTKTTSGPGTWYNLLIQSLPIIGLVTFFLILITIIVVIVVVKKRRETKHI